MVTLGKYFSKSRIVPSSTALQLHAEECDVVVKTIFKSPFPLIFSAISFTISLPTTAKK